MATVSYLDRLLEPVTGAFTIKFARKMAGLRIDPQLEDRLAVLRRKANDGSLTPEEDAEYKDFVESLDVISILQSKARRFLAKHPK